ncbi:MAG: NAD-dependent epimerase [Candidatus Latescibacteria bacterium]|nr:NAD-dependent epimerase [Candidatus Latescibacterota bacterium]MBT5832274.1 NAD-dependent epimerase [Candidatus Latescibacterota bacterium]
MPLLVTGSAGFIGYHTCVRLLNMGHTVVGIDHLNAYYDVNLKRDRLKQLDGRDGFTFIEMDLNQIDELSALFQAQGFEQVINLAAQAGVPYSLENPKVYVDSNVSGFLNVLECCRHHNVKHLIYASSSSVYGQNTEMPFSTKHPVDHPMSLYAATKRANELMAHAYSSAFTLPTTGLRFFTVYGPWGRPDMALFLFVDAILNNRPIDVYNEGKSQRSFTYVDDIVEGIVRLLKHIPQADETIQPDRPDHSSAPFHLYNIGSDQTVALEYFITVIEGLLDKKAQKNYLPLRTGDVPRTYADIDSLEDAVGYRPTTSIEVGIEKFVAWYREYYGV